jgi:acetoin utilization protein AcuC
LSSPSATPADTAPRRWIAAAQAEEEEESRMQASFVNSAIYGETGYRGNHPLAIQRIGSVVTLCHALGWLGAGNAPAWVESPVATEAELRAFHHPDYIAAFRAISDAGRATPEQRDRYRIGTMENPVFPGMFRRASTSVGGSILAARLAMQGGIAYHPAGGTHHGMPGHASGFCYFNDPVFAILTLLEEGAARVLYVDLDAHHGDGVEAAFARDPRVMTISVHEENRWPWTGTLGSRAAANAQNLPVPKGMNDSEMTFLLQGAVLPLAQGFAPAAVVITCGADALAGDPLSSLALSNTCLWDAVMALTKIAPASVVLGGGGYNPWTVARCWAGLWGRIAGHDIPEALPKAASRYLETLDCDLVDEEERDPAWMTTLADLPNTGQVRPEFHHIVAAIMAPQSDRAVA